ncbi:MAG: leucine-rich repeat domain-containing protein [Bacteroidales bacterium]|jgi:hypothetical protein|nr:leucine-rich repeat domain-containing protein [Bacteroidales bacterium]
MKKVLFIFCIAIGLNCNARNVHETEIDGIYYTLFDNDSYAIVEKSFYGEDGYYRGNITIPSYVTYYSDTYKVTGISIKAFQNCGGLRRVTIPNSIKEISYSAFENCNVLTEVEIPNSVSSIGNNAFSGCNNLNFHEYDNGLYLGNSENPYYALIKAKSKNITTCEINDRCEVVADGAFYECEYLINVIIPNSVKFIGDLTFSGCKRITDITIPDSVEKIGYYTFSRCTNLKKITMPKNLKKIDSFAFNECSGLITITIPNGVEDISVGAFKNCRSLNKITIPNRTKDISYSAFSGCTGLETVIIESANEQLQIKKNAFEKCPNLKSITCEAKIPPLCENLGIDVDKVILYVPKESVGLYESSKEYWPYIKKIEGK